MQWRGDLLTNLARISAVLDAAALQAVTAAAEHVLEEALKVVPLEDGELSQSGTVSAEIEGSTAVAAISFGTPYAVRQHEVMSYRNDPGREAKFLERPLFEEASTVAKIAADHIGQALR